MDTQIPQARLQARSPGSDPISPALPTIPSLEHLRKQAKHLLAACRGGDAAALARIQRWFPEAATDGGAPKLSHAHLAVAREHGCTSWTHLRRAVLTALVERLAVRHWSDWRTAAAARRALEREGEEGLLAVLEGLSHIESRVRRGAVEYFGRHADDRCLPRLTELVLHDPVAYVRWSALSVLRSRRRGTLEPAALDPVLAAVAQCDPSPRVRWRAVGSLPTPELVRAARDDPSLRVRRRAMEALGGRPGSELAHRTLEAAVQGPDADLRRAAHQALRRLSPEYRQQAARRARAANLARSGVPGVDRPAPTTH